MNQKLFPTINILHIALTMGPFMFFIVMATFAGGLPSQPTNFSDPFVYLGIAGFISAFAFNFLAYPGRINKISTAATLQQKVASWRSLFIVRCAITEGACLLCITGMLVTEYAFFLYVFIPLFVLLASYFPTKNKVQNELALSEEEMQQI